MSLTVQDITILAKAVGTLGLFQAAEAEAAGSRGTWEADVWKPLWSEIGAGEQVPEAWDPAHQQTDFAPCSRLYIGQHKSCFLFVKDLFI